MADFDQFDQSPSHGLKKVGVRNQVRPQLEFWEVSVIKAVLWAGVTDTSAYDKHFILFVIIVYSSPVYAILLLSDE